MIAQRALINLVHFLSLGLGSARGQENDKETFFAMIFQAKFQSICGKATAKIKQAQDPSQHKSSQGSGLVFWQIVAR